MRLPVVYGICCRVWPLFPHIHIGRCGYCGERPVIPADQPEDT